MSPAVTAPPTTRLWAVPAAGATPPLPPGGGLPLPHPHATPAQAAAYDGLISRLTYALALDARSAPTPGAPGRWTVTTLGGEFGVTLGTTYRCTCPQAHDAGPYTPATVTASCAHILLVLWLGSDARTRDRWGACYPALAAAGQVYDARSAGHVHQPGTLAALAAHL